MLWRLVVNGVRGAGGHDLPPRGRGHHGRALCSCGWEGGAPDGAARERALAFRWHCFWDCPVAGAVVDEIRRALPAGVTVTCADVWLLRPPQDCGLHAGVWALVCMVAVEAMDRGRRLAWALLKKDEGRRAGGQTLMTDFLPLAAGVERPGVAVRAARKAGAWLWCLLQDFVNLQMLPDGWGQGVDPEHAFVGVVGPIGSWTLKLNVPGGITLPEDMYV